MCVTFNICARARLISKGETILVKTTFDAYKKMASSSNRTYIDAK